MSDSVLDSVAVDLAYAVRQLERARQASGMSGDRQALDCIQRALDGLERVKEALESAVAPACTEVGDAVKRITACPDNPV